MVQRGTEQQQPYDKAGTERFREPDQPVLLADVDTKGSTQVEPQHDLDPALLVALQLRIEASSQSVPNCASLSLHCCTPWHNWRRETILNLMRWHSMHR